MPSPSHDDALAHPPRLPGHPPRAAGGPRPPGPPEPSGGSTRSTAHGRPPVVTYTLIGLCTAVFLISPVSGLIAAYGTGHAQLCAQSAYFAHWGVIPGELLHGRLPAGAAGGPAGCPAATPDKVPFLSVLTALFVHGGWLHLLGNMLFLLVFGADVEERMGRVAFALFYLAAGYVATYGYALGQANSTQTLVGASGAIAGVLGAYLLLYPRARVTSLFPFLLFLPLRLPAWLVLGFWFALQWFAARTDGTGPGVAYLAHVIGFAFGFLCAAAARRRLTAERPRRPAPPPV